MADKSVAVAATRRWLFGPKSDLLLGCGLLYLMFFLLLALQGRTIEALLPLSVTPLIALFLSIPHYGSTLLRVYESPQSRHKYQFFSVYLTGAIFLWFVVSVYSSLAGTLLLSLYMMWSPWHYMGQNYGIALLFLGRRGISISEGTKRLIHVSFLLSFLLTLTEIQSFPSSTGFYRVLTLELSPGMRDTLFTVLGVLYLASTAAAAAVLAQRASLRDLLPTLLIIFTQALWFLVPLFAIRLGLFQSSVALSMDYAIYAFFWVAIAHAIQYLWITGYFAINTGADSSLPGFLLKALLAGALVWVVPVFLFSPGLLGTRTYGAGLSILIAAAVNVHHFVLDGAIWKLREGRVAAVLLRSVSPQSETAAMRTRPLLKPVLMTIGLACVVAHYLGTISALNVQQAITMGDLDRAESAMETLQLLQRDDAGLRGTLARLAVEKDDLERAEDNARVALRLNPSEANRDLMESVQARAQSARLRSGGGDVAEALSPFSPKLTR